MLAYVLRRLLQSVLVLLGVSVIVFGLLHLTGDPTRLLLPLEAREEDVRQLRALLGLDDPLWVQYLRFLSRAVRGDFGLSFKHQVPALTLIRQTLPATLELTAAGLALALLVAVPAGILAALRRNSLLDAVCSVGVLLGQAMPVYWLGLLLILVFAVWLGWFPAGGPRRAGIAGAAGHRARGLLDGAHRADGALGHARGARAGLCPHRARRRPAHLRGDVQVRAQERGHPARHHRGPRVRHSPGRRRDHGDDLCLAGRRPARGGRDLQPRLPAGAGHRRHARHALRPDQPGDGPRSTPISTRGSSSCGASSERSREPGGRGRSSPRRPARAPPRELPRRLRDHGASPHGRRGAGGPADRPMGSGAPDARQAAPAARVAGAGPARASARHRPPRARHPEPHPLRGPDLPRRRPLRRHAVRPDRRHPWPPRRLPRRAYRCLHHARGGRLPRDPLYPARDGRGLRARPEPPQRDPGDGGHPLGAVRPHRPRRRAVDPRARVRERRPGARQPVDARCCSAMSCRMR